MNKSLEVVVMDDGAFDDSDVRVGADAMRVFLQDRPDIPESVKLERDWLLLGQRLRRSAPRLYQLAFAMILSAISDDDEIVMHKSYYDS